jgi:hypothetical protein
MKKITILFVLLLAIVSCSEDKGNLHISGEIKGLSQGKLYIQRVKDTVLKPIKVIKFDGDSKFETYLNVQEPEVLYLFLDRGVTNSLDNNVAFFADKGKLKIISDVNSFIAKAEISGNENQDLLNEYNKVMANYANKNVDFIQQRIKAESDKNTVLSDSLRKMEDAIFKRRYLYTIDFCLKNADKEIAPYLAVSEILDVNPKFLDSIHNSLSEPVRSSKYGKIFTEYLTELKAQE